MRAHKRFIQLLFPAVLLASIGLAQPAASQQPAAEPRTSGLNYEVFKERVQPILMSPRKGQRPMHGLSFARRRQ